MKRHAITSNQTTDHKRQSHTGTFAKVFDGRKQPIRGLWVRNGRYYAQLTFEDGNTLEKKTRRVPLLDKDKSPVTTAAQAVEAMGRLKVDRSDDNLPVLTRTPKFADYVNTYLSFIKSGQENGTAMKKAGTIEKEEYTLEGWVKELGNELRLDKIRRAHVNKYVSKRLKQGIARRTVNLDMIAFRNVMKHAIDENWIKVLPTQNMRPLKCSDTKRDLFASSDLDVLCDAALARKEDGSPVTKNGQQFADYLRFMAFSGTRRNEALGTQWEDVDFDGEQLNIRRQVTSRGVETLKNHGERTLDLNAKLKALLLDLHSRRAPDSIWLFPSPQRGDKDIPAKSFRESLELVREQIKAKHPKLVGKAFHDLRHHFISYCVMSGIDYMTVAEWVGHQDGGILIGKVYGHLAEAHKKQQAQKLSFGPALLQTAV
jgi:integrase